VAIAERRSHWLNGLAVPIGTVVAAIPFVGYATAYLYEWGVAHQFGYPRELIVVDLTKALAAGVYVALICGVLVIIAVLAREKVNRAPESARWLIDSLPLVAFVTLVWLAARGESPSWERRPLAVGPEQVGSGDRGLVAEC
jgi:hypothetical protein